MEVLTQEKKMQEKRQMKYFDVILDYLGKITWEQLAKFWYYMECCVTLGKCRSKEAKTMIHKSVQVYDSESWMVTDNFKKTN